MITTLVNIISDWILAAIIFIQSGAIAWIVFRSQQRIEAQSIITNTANAARRLALRTLTWTSPIVFCASLAITSWPLTRFGFVVIMVSGMSWVYLSLIQTVMWVGASLIAINKDFVDLHKMHTAIAKKLLKDTSGTPEETTELVEELNALLNTIDNRRNSNS